MTTRTGADLDDLLADKDDNVGGILLDMLADYWVVASVLSFVGFAIKIILA